MTTADYEKCALRIADALQLAPGEKVVLKLDRRVFDPLAAPLRNVIRVSGAHVAGVISAEDQLAADGEIESLRKLFSDADVFIWLPELHQGNRPALAQALNEWLDARRGRAVHFHWNSGSYPLGLLGMPPQALIDQLYLAALDVGPSELDRRHQRAIQWLRSGPVRVTTTDGTDLTFEVGNRPFTSQTGDATRERMRSAQTRIDRDIELPAGVLRVAPIENTVKGRIFLPVWRPIVSEGRNLMLHFVHGRVALQGVNADKIDQELSAAGGDARMFREFALGFNPALKILPEFPFIAYYGYGSGVVRLSLGDNEEMGGANRGGGVYWNFIGNATVTVDDRIVVKDGKLAPELDI